MGGGGQPNQRKTNSNGSRGAVQYRDPEIKRKREAEGGRGNTSTNPAHAMSAQASPECRHAKCQERAFRHKQERGGAVHESGMCFDHFVEAVREGKKEKPGGVPLKGGKTVVLKRGEDKRWKFQILSVTVGHENGEEDRRVRQRTLEEGESSHAFSAMLKMKQEELDQKMFEQLVVESEGGFDIGDLGSELEMKIFDVRKGGGCGEE